MIKFIANILHKYHYSLNNSKLLAGICLLLINIGSKYIELNISTTQADYIKSAVGRELLIFAMVFIGTRDVLLSILISSAFIILSDTVFNENNRFCIIPEKHKKIEDKKENQITEDAINKAYDILHKAKIQSHKTLMTANYDIFQNNLTDY